MKIEVDSLPEGSYMRYLRGVHGDKAEEVYAQEQREQAEFDRQFPVQFREYVKTRTGSRIWLCKNESHPWSCWEEPPWRYDDYAYSGHDISVEKALSIIEDEDVIKKMKRIIVKENRPAAIAKKIGDEAE